MNVNARNLQAMLAKRETTHKGYTFILQGDILWMLIKALKKQLWPFCAAGGCYMLNKKEGRQYCPSAYQLASHWAHNSKA